jgi:hypothetical protein
LTFGCLIPIHYEDLCLKGIFRTDQKPWPFVHTVKIGRSRQNEEHGSGMLHHSFREKLLQIKPANKYKVRHHRFAR